MNRTDATGYRPGYNSDGYLDPTPEEAIRNMRQNGRQARALPEAKEDAEQIAVIEWAGYMTGKYPPLSRLLHIPNGGSRNRIEAAKLKRMGVRPGVPDLLLPYPIGDWSGLWLEMKTEKGRPTPEQRDWIEYLRSAGYLAYICHGAGEAINALEAYLAAVQETPAARVRRLEMELAAARNAQKLKWRPNRILEDNWVCPICGHWSYKQYNICPICETTLMKNDIQEKKQ